MFFGYESEAQMRSHNPRIAGALVRLARRQDRTVCNGGGCTGSVDGSTYLYSNGRSDRGRKITDCRAEFGGHTFRWAAPNQTETNENHDN